MINKGRSYSYLPNYKLMFYDTTDYYFTDSLYVTRSENRDPISKSWNYRESPLKQGREHQKRWQDWVRTQLSQMRNWRAPKQGEVAYNFWSWSNDNPVPGSLVGREKETKNSLPLGLHQRFDYLCVWTFSWFRLFLR